MQAAMTHGYLAPFNQRADIRNEPRVRLRIECTPSMHVVSGGHMLTRGSNDVVVYKSDLRAIQAEVEDSVADILAAKKAHEKHEAEHYRRRYERDNITEAERDAAPYPGSVEYEFRVRMDRDIRPLSKLEILEELPPPDEALTASPHLMVNQFAESIARALAEHTNKTSSDKAQRR